MSNINGKLRQKICTALQDAFPDFQTLKMMLSFKLDEKLNNISEKDRLDKVVFNLIEEYERKGDLDELIIAAIRGNPGNTKLIELAPEINSLSDSLSEKPLSNVFDNELLPILKKINER